MPDSNGIELYDSFTHKPMISIGKIDVRDIQFIKGLDDFIRIHLPHNKILLTLMSLKAIFKKLPRQEFVRLHHSY